jgi:serine/threonine protein phosphatase PrpC
MNLPPPGPPRVWRTLTRSEKGMNHAVCQDSCDAKIDSTGRVVAAVADGHGGKRYFRSDEGARLAVAAALASAQDGLDESRCNEEWVKEELPKDIATRWRGQVDAHAKENPFNPEEKRLLGQTTGIPLEFQHLVPYGTTLLLAVLGPGFLACVQLGDGDILALTDDETIWRPITVDPSLIANETHSLASFFEDHPVAEGTPALRYEPWRLARCAFKDEPPLATPKLLLLASDGYSNSFRDPAEFERVATDYAAAIRSYGIPAVEAEMTAWLRETTDAGSGDDISMVLVFDGALAAPAESDDSGADARGEAVAGDGEPEVEG